MAKTIELTDQQRELLVEVLDKVLGDLSYEISDTDNRTYKAGLKDRRDALKAINDQLK